MPRPVSLLVALVVVAGAVARAQPLTPLAPARNHFLFLIDTSFSMRRERITVRNLLAEWIRTGLDGQMHAGDRYTLWPFNEEVYPQRFRAQVWLPELNLGEANRVYDFLVRQPYERRTRLDKALAAAAQVMHATSRLTVILLSDGDDEVHGTPFDRQLNAIYLRRYRTLRKARRPFITVLTAEDETWAAWAVYAAGDKIVLPAPLVRTASVAPAPTPAPPAQPTALPATTNPAAPPPITPQPTVAPKTAAPHSQTPETTAPARSVATPTPPPTAKPSPRASAPPSPPPQREVAVKPAVPPPSAPHPITEERSTPAAPEPAPERLATPAAVPTPPLSVARPVAPPLSTTPAAPNTAEAVAVHAGSGPGQEPNRKPGSATNAGATLTPSHPEPRAVVGAATPGTGRGLLILGLALMGVAVGLMVFWLRRRRSPAGASFITRSLDNPKE